MSSNEDYTGFLSTGASVDQYRILSELRSGGSASVYAAEDGRLKRPAILKFLHTDAQTSEVVAEARAGAKLNHPNIVTVYDVGE